MRDVRIAAVCMVSPPGQVEENLRKTERFAAVAAARGAEIVCFPELSISGYSLRDSGEPAPSPRNEEIILRIEDVARREGILVLAGFAELAEDGGQFISQVVAGPQGLMGIYRKTHLSPQEREGFRPGNDLKTYSHEGITFGVQLCYESHFPEISTVLALQGVEIIFIPHASPRGTPEEKYQSWLRHLPARAFDNTVFVVACNQADDSSARLTFPGIALVLDPLGKVIAGRREGEEGILVADLKADDLRQARNHRMRYFLSSRRPELYGEVVSKKKEESGSRRRKNAQVQGTPQTEE